MAIKGSLAEAALSNVIQLLTISLKSGCLSTTDGKNFGNIFIKDGKIIHATILNRNERLGDVLILKNIIDQGQLNQALELQRSDRRKRLGEILISMSAITREILENELKAQIEQTIFSMLTWESGYFNFEAGLLPSAEEYTVQLSPQEVLLEAARRISEWRKIENKIPPFETILIRKGNVSDFPLIGHETRVLELINGQRSIDEVLRISGLEFFDACKVIYGLLSAGLIEKPEQPIKRKDDVVELKNLGIGFYKTEKFEDSEREFRKIVDLDSKNSEALMYLGLVEIKRNNFQSAKEYFVRALEQEKRLSLLINLGYTCTKLGQYNEAVSYLSAASELSQVDPQVKCNLAIAYYKQGNLDKAAEIFKQLLEVRPDFITPHVYLSVINWKRNEPDNAVRQLEEAAAKFPSLSVFKNNLAVFYEGVGKSEEAEKLYRQAFDLEPQNLAYCRNLADFYYDAQILGAAKELYERIPDEMKDWHVLFNLGKIHLRQGSAAEALTFWEKAKAQNPHEEIIAKNIEALKRSVT